MAPIIKPGWDLYNCHPPPGRIRRAKRSAQATAPASWFSSPTKSQKAVQNPSNQDLSKGKPKNAALKRCTSLPAHRSLQLPGDQNVGFCRNRYNTGTGSGGAQLNLLHRRAATLHGHYRVTSFSTESLHMRILAMQAIPEVDYEDDDYDYSRSSRGSMSHVDIGMVASNPELATTPVNPAVAVAGGEESHHMHGTHALFTRFRSIFSRTKSCANLPTSGRMAATSNVNGGTPSCSSVKSASAAGHRSLPSFIRSLQRSRR